MSENVKVSIVKEADGALGVVRVSLVGSVALGGYYCVYRGRKEDAMQCLAIAAEAMRAMAESIGDDEPQIEPDGGKRFA
jgi:hypothetical protein